ncbi:levansucrase [Acinetobacter nectaris CIP 110549]|uniref:levansucrase n=3 Tax=Acinetobacter nectaris TaxID=1219382 RepID=V2TN31_9GAMM|nr:glycoside hydrolase family 68 protein [Acinetobacter nectaris]ESK38742.1 levansucrase [Acinetobacter nectaris CIP 110549]
MTNLNFQSTIWTRADALKVHTDDPTTTQPLVPANFPVLDDRLFIWDTMPLRTLDGTIVSVDGWSVIFTLTAERSPEKFKDANGDYDITADWNDRHGRARICFWYSRDGKSWIFGGRVMKEGVSPTSREWAGTPILLNDQGDIDLYYTCVTPGATISKVRGRLVTSDEGVSVAGFTTVKSLFSADGTYYQTEEQNTYWNFRDPCPFIDPNDGQLYMVFEGNVAGDRGTHTIGSAQMGDVPPGHTDVGGARYQTGCIGIAVATDSSGESWELLPPLVTAVGVNDQTERPHYVFKDGKYYLFTISHKYTYADGLTGPDGVYGFVSENLTGPYRPMNSSGLVLGNPSSQPFQTYSHYVMPNGLVTSFIDSVPVPTPNPKDLQYRIGGTEAPTVRIELVGDRSFVVETLDFGYIPAMRDVQLKEKSNLISDIDSIFGSIVKGIFG